MRQKRSVHSPRSVHVNLSLRMRSARYSCEPLAIALIQRLLAEVGADAHQHTWLRVCGPAVAHLETGVLRKHPLLLIMLFLSGMRDGGNEKCLLVCLTLLSPEFVQRINLQANAPGVGW